MGPARDAPPVQPRLDSWRRLQHAASWLWMPLDRAESSDVLNDWVATRVTRLLAALRPLARPAAVHLNGTPASGRSLPTLVPEPGEDPDAFTDRVLDRIRTADFELSGAELTLDLCAWVHVDGAEQPTRGWIARSADLDLLSELEDPYGALSLDHTLFRDGDTHGVSNHELYLLNAPLLRDALQAIQAVEGPIIEIEGLSDVTAQGFAPR